MKKILIVILLLTLSFSQINAQDDTSKEKVKLHLKIKENANPDVYVDGKKFEFSTDLIDPNAIASINVIKGEEAKKTYNAPNGVILITTKENSKKEKFKNTVLILDKTNHNGEKVSTSKLEINSNGKQPLIIVDGIVVDKETLKKLSPDDIDHIKVLKDKKAIEKYNAKNGVIIIKTKK